MPHPRFSVILISYNQEAFIEDAISSLLASSVTDFEVICVDDGSHDSTVSKLRQVARLDARVTLVEMAHSGKPAVARNTGLSVARGEYVCFMDGDDVADRDRLASFNNGIRLGHDDIADDIADVVFGDYVDLPIDPAAPRQPCIKGTRNETALLSILRPGLTAQDSLSVELQTDRLVGWLVSNSFLINTLTVCIRHELIRTRHLRFPTDRKIGEDNIFWLKSLIGSRVVFVNRIVAYWRKHPHSLTARRSAASQRELTLSMREELAVAAHVLTVEERLRGIGRVYHEEFEIGWLFEAEDAWYKAIAAYVQVAISHRSSKALAAAVKAPIRHVMRQRLTRA